jgi:thiamine-phosphate diphosphorylase
VLASSDSPRFPRLHLVTDDGVLADPGFPRRVEAVLEAGGERVAIHLRGPGTSGGTLYRRAEAVRAATRGAGAWLVVNDRIDVALAAGADGVQLGVRGIGLADARGLPGGLRLGASVHSVEEGRGAAGAGADFLVAGSIYATRSHPGRAPAGLPLVEGLRGCGRPLIAIGGVSPPRVAELVRAGAHGVAVIRGVWEAPSPRRAVAEFLERLEDSLGT